ncbi:MAG: hypothetical protein RR365_04820 [Bacteroides sp.]
MKFMYNQPFCFVYLGVHLNSLLDKGETWNIADILFKAEQETLVSWLETQLDMSPFDTDDKRVLSEEFASLANAVDAEKKMGVSQNGICLLIAYCFELIQNKPTRM